MFCNLSAMYRNIFLSLLCMFCLSAPLQAQDLETIGQQKPFQVSGGVSANTYFYSTSREFPSRKPFSWVLSGNATASIYGVVDVPVSFVISERNRSFRQSFNQFGMSPRYKWATLHLGYRNISFSRYTLAGHTFLGAGVELEPSIFRFGFIYGRFLKPIEYEADSLLDYEVTPTYLRKGYAVKLGIGNRANSFDMILFKAKDDPNSIEVPDSADTKPAENFVLGLKTNHTFFSKLTFNADFAVSAYTIDVTAEPVEDEYPLSGLLTKFYQPRLSTQVLLAGDASLAYRMRFFNIALKYTRIEPDYQTMGAYYFMTDIENFTLAPSFTILKRKVRVNGSFGLQRNNLLETKSDVTLRRIGSVTVSVAPTAKLGFTVNYNNFQFERQRYLPVRNTLDVDTFRLDQVSQSMGVTSNYRWGEKKIRHTFNFRGNYQTYTNESNAEAGTVNNDSKSFNSGVTYRYLNSISEYGLNAGLQFNQFERETINSSRFGFNLGGDKKLLESKLNLRSSLAYYRNINNGGKGNTLALRGSVNYQVLKKHNLFLNLSWVRRTQENQVSYSGSDFLGNLGYNMSF